MWYQEEDEDLEAIMLNIARTNRYANAFNPQYGVILREIISFPQQVIDKTLFLLIRGYIKLTTYSLYKKAFLSARTEYLFLLMSIRDSFLPKTAKMPIPVEDYQYIPEECPFSRDYESEHTWDEDFIESNPFKEVI